MIHDLATPMGMGWGTHDFSCWDSTHCVNLLLSTGTALAACIHVCRVIFRSKEASNCRLVCTLTERCYILPSLVACLSESEGVRASMGPSSRGRLENSNKSRTQYTSHPFLALCVVLHKSSSTERGSCRTSTATICSLLHTGISRRILVGHNVPLLLY